MMRQNRLSHRLVDCIPDALESGLLYISLEYATAVHLCCCGCGEEVVTPITPTDWKVTFDGETASLWPSIGSWTLKCRSHYVIAGGKVIWSRNWSDKQIAAERRRDRTAKARYYNNSLPIDGTDWSSEPVGQMPPSFWRRLRCWLRA